MDIDKILLNKVKDLEMYKIISNPINYKNVINKLTINNNFEIKDIIRSVITNYVDNIFNVIPNNYLEILNSNLNTLKLVKKDVSKEEVINKDSCSFYPALYYLIENTIIYFDKEIYELLGTNYKEILKQVFNHEMLHLSSTIIENNTIYSGLAVNDLGDYLNEGYTELINDLILDNNIVLTNYEYEKRIALILSNFIGNDKMLKCYFNANTRYFNRTLNKYSDSKDILHILRIIDRIGINKKNKNLSNDKHNNIINQHLELTNYILKVHTNKLIEMLNDNLINLDTSIDNITTLSLFMFSNARFIACLNKEDADLLREKITIDLLNEYINKLYNYNKGKTKILK